MTEDEGEERGVVAKRGHEEVEEGGEAGKVGPIQLWPTSELTVLGLLPHDALQVDAGARLARPQALGLRGQRRVGRVHRHRARADHDLLARR